MDLVANERRFLDGLAGAAGVDRGRLDRPGTTVTATEDRADSNALACYRSGDHLVIWGDPAVVDRAADLGGTDPWSSVELKRTLGKAGFTPHATVICNLLDGPPPPPSSSMEGYVGRWLDGDDPRTVELVRAFADRCDPGEVEAAALDELDDYDEAAINVLSPHPDGDPRHMVAYASASAWPWDPALADIGVLVDAGHRRRGLARFVVAATVGRLTADGRIPFYRHEIGNTGSAAVAAGIGFHPVARLDYFVDASSPGP